MKSIAPNRRNTFQIQNRQKNRPINLRAFRKLAELLLDDLLDLPGYDLAVHVLEANKMAEMNSHFLNHDGSTDVMTFDYREGYPELGSMAVLHGEIFISVEDAVQQAREFNTSWRDEFARYFVHGVLHLMGYDDLVPAKRKVMKQQEEKLVKRLGMTGLIERL
jgi:probable rRNA maturation factor